MVAGDGDRYDDLAPLIRLIYILTLTLILHDPAKLLLLLPLLIPPFACARLLVALGSRRLQSKLYLLSAYAAPRDASACSQPLAAPRDASTCSPKSQDPPLPS